MASRPRRPRRPRPDRPSTIDRPVPHVVPPPKHRLTLFEIYDNKTFGKPNLDVLRNHFFIEGRLEESAVMQIIEEGAELFKTEDTLITVASPVIFCGDIHGQYYDLLKIFERGGPPIESTYLFLGDYVDRGSFGIEVVLLLWAMKLNYPNNIFLVRGNHESRGMTDYFTFKMECLNKYSVYVYLACMNAFDCLPLAALVDNKILCMHGGLSPDIMTLNQIREIDRFQEPPESGPMCDLLWSDPDEDFGEELHSEFFLPNEERKCSYVYSYIAVCDFLINNNLITIVRAHEVQDEGFRMYKAMALNNFPAVITVFSAPNYLDSYYNRGAIISYKDNEMNVIQYYHSPHPFCLPNCIDVFTWSLSYVAEEVGKMIMAMLEACRDDSDSDDDVDMDGPSTSSAVVTVVAAVPAGAAATADTANAGDTANVDTAANVENNANAPSTSNTASTSDTTIATTIRSKFSIKQSLKYKIKAIGIMSRLFSVIRQESVAIVKLKGLTPCNILPLDALGGGRASLENALAAFMPYDKDRTYEEIKMLDAINEHRPPRRRAATRPVDEQNQEQVDQPNQEQVDEPMPEQVVEPMPEPVDQPNPELGEAANPE